MLRRSWIHAVFAATAVLGGSVAGSATAQEAFTIDVYKLLDLGCIGQPACDLEGTEISAGSGVLAKPSRNGDAGIGVSGGHWEDEIGIGETLRVDLAEARQIRELKFLYLYNGPEFGESAEKAQVVADGIVYTLSVRNDVDDAMADWSGPGSVTKCSDTTATGTGCFVVTNPFPLAVSLLEFNGVAGDQPYPASGGPATSETDFAVGRIDVAAQQFLHLPDCSGPTGCPVATIDGQVAFSLNSVQVQNPGGSLDALVVRVSLPDCRYIPQVCLAMLPPAGDSAASDDAARSLLMDLGVIKSREPSGPNKLSPPVQLLNVTPLLPPEVTSLFDASGTPPGGLPALYMSNRWRAQAVNAYWFDAFFFRTDPGLMFSNVFEGLIDVSLLTGNELGCFADTNDLLAWDVIATVSELAKSVGSEHHDSMINVGCVNPTKVAGTRLSLYSVNLEIVDDTYGPTIKTSSPKVTVNNDAVFARLLESLWADLGEIETLYACKKADPEPSAGPAPLSEVKCKELATLWANAGNNLKLCVNATFKPANAKQAATCDRAIASVNAFEAALPATASGPDPYNRLGELKSRVDVFQHVWTERFLKSIKPGGFCREQGSCPP